MYYLLIVCLALSALLTINALGSVIAAVVWFMLARPARRLSASARARLLFALRIFPPASAFVSVAMLFIPSYLAYEPLPPDEAITMELALLALASAGGLTLAIVRGLKSWRATRRLVKKWARDAELLNLKDLPLPAYRVQHAFPVVAVVGVIRARLFITEQVLSSLTDDEIRAAVRHEVGHLITRDNFKRVLTRACHDLLFIMPCDRSIDRAWTAATEAAADEYAAEGGSKVALDLASALIRISRMIPTGLRPSTAIASSLIGDDGGGIAWRVRRLAELAERGALPKSRDGRLANIAVQLSLGTLFVAAIYTATNPRALEMIHAGMERVLSLLN